MNISVFHTVEDAKKAKGLTVVIDVFRAFSTACYVFDNKAKTIIPVGNIAIAYKLKKENPDFILMGERNGVSQPGFDFGNSPFRIKDIDFSGKTVIHTTTAGTQGLVNAKQSEQIITGSFVNANAIVRYIKKLNPPFVSIVCTGTPDEYTMNEDALCAEYLKNALTDKPNNFEKIKADLHSPEFSSWFFDPKIITHPIEDFDLCLDLDRFDFVLKAEPYRNGLLCLKMIR